MTLLRNNHGGRARLALLLPVLLIGGMLAAWAQTYRDTPYGARFGMANGTATTTIEADGDAEFAGDVTANAFIGDGSGLTGVSASGGIADPGSSVDNEILRWNGTSGAAVQASGITIADGASGTLAGSNSGDVSLSGTPDYITISGQTITRGLIDLAADVTGDLAYSNFTQSAQATVLGRASGAGTGDVSALTLLQLNTILNTPVAITSSSNATAWNSDNAKTFTHTTTEATTIAASSGTPFNGQVVCFRITQSAGGYAVSWNAQFAAGATFSDTIPANSTTNGDIDVYLFQYEGALSKYILLAHVAH